MVGDKEHVCPSCGKETCEEGHMCVPVEKEDTKCKWCGAMIPNERHVCKDKLDDIAFVCNSCGRTAVRAELLCEPKMIE